jgi:hypothetical protein
VSGNSFFWNRSELFVTCRRSVIRVSDTAICLIIEVFVLHSQLLISGEIFLLMLKKRKSFNITIIWKIVDNNYDVFFFVKNYDLFLCFWKWNIIFIFLMVQFYSNSTAQNFWIRPLVVLLMWVKWCYGRKRDECWSRRSMMFYVSMKKYKYIKI